MKHHLIFVLAIFVFILGTVSPQVQPSISFTPAQPRPGETVTFTLHPSTSNIIGSAIVWDFGDSTATLSTGISQRVVSHVFARVGTFVVGSRYYLASERIENPKVTVTVGEAEGPRAAFAISGLLLRWNDGRTSIQVGKDFSPLIAYADLKFQGTGILYYQWLVDGNVFKTGQTGLTFAGQATIDSGATPGLPTQMPGIHQVSLRFVRPAASFALPVITYEVAAASRRLPPPRIDQAIPSQLEPGKEYELSLVGSGLTADTDISLGLSIAILEKAKILSEIQATLKVFVPLTAKKGEYPVSASNANGTSSGPAAVTIGLATKPIVTAKPLPAKAFCPDFSAVKHGLTMVDHGYSTMKEMKSTKVLILDDYPTFRWTPANLGQTEFWDFLILDKSRKNVLFRRRLDAFVLQTKLTSAEVVKLVADAKGSHWAAQTETLRPQSGSEAGIPVETEVPDWTIDDQAWAIRDKGDVYVGVAGYRRYTCLGGSLTEAKPASGGPQTKTGDEFAFRTYEIVTEHSGLFPYRLPGLPAGIGCPEGGQTRPGNSVQCAPTFKEKIKQPNGKYAEDPNNYVDTPFRVSGDFSVADSPYNVEGGDFSYPPKSPPPGPSPYSSIQPSNAPPIIDLGQIKNPEAGPPATANFNNIFIDWGDGTVERLSAEPSDPDMQYWQYRDLGVLGVLGSNNRAVRWRIIPPKDHYYQKTGIYTFRIYQLGEDDIQQPAQNFTGALGEATSGGAGDADFNYLSSIIGKSGPKAEKTETDPSAALGGALSRAYLIFCTPITITNRIDLCADGPLNLVSLQITGFPLHDVKKAYAIAAVAGPDAVATTCDSGLHAVANLIYFGRGSVEVSWRVGDVVIGKSRIDGLSSPPRTGLSKGEQGDCDNAIKAVLEIKSPPLPVQELGKYSVKTEARVVFDFADPGLATTSLSALQSLQAKSGNPSSQAWLNSLKGAQSPQVGLINSGSGPGAFAYLNDILPTALAPLSAAAFDQPPLAVSSGPKIYEVKAADPKQLCRIWIPTPEGRFEVSDLQNNVQKDAAGFKGQGMLHLPLSRSSDANETYLVPIQFSGWQVDEASGDLKNGALDFSPGLSVLPPGTKGTLDRVAVKVTNGTGTPLAAIMSLGFRDQALRLPGEVETPPQFPKLSATLTAEGDWLKENVVLPEILIGWSAFHIKSPAIAFDFHKKKGALPAGECSNGEVSWVGVNLGQATILPYTFDMVGNTPYVLQVNNWGIVDKGMCGKLQGGPFHADYQEGWLEFGGLTFSAANASYVVQYKNLVVHVPWVGTDLKGDATLKKFEGGYGIDLGAVTGQAPPLDYGQFVLRPQDLSFLSEKNLGWVVGSVTACEFNADSKPFAKLTLAHLFFGFDGRAYFEEGATSKAFSLGGQSTLGSTPLDLINIDIAAPSKGTGRLDFAFHTKVHLSENPIIPAADVQINYNVFRSGAAYQGTGPTNNPFTCEVVFPVGNPVMTAQIRPVYFPAGSSPGGGAEPVPAALGAGPSEFETGVSAGASQDTRWYGDLDMALFGGPSVKAQLLIGYRSGKSYFLMRADYPLGPTGIPFAPLPFSLFRLSGALGYNFPVDAFKNVSTTSIANAEPDMGGDTLFMSGMRIGSSDKFSFTLDGTFTVSTAGAARMDFGAWILQAPSGTANFQGCFTYGGGNFDGRLWGRLSFFGDLILFDLGTSESNAAVDLHFGSGTWHIYAGQKDGARIRAKVLFGESDAYLMLGTDVGLALGGAFDMYFGIGDSSIASAYVKAFMDIGLQVTPQPKVVGDFAAGVSAGVCAIGVCVDGSVDAQVHVEAFPVDASASVSLDLPWPLPSISFTVHL